MGKHQPALLGGLFIGVLSSLPLVAFGNLCCCLWVVLGGGLTVYLQQQRTSEPVETGDAVLGGLLAGLIGACVFAVGQALVAALAQSLGLGGGIEDLRPLFEENPEIPPALVNMMERIASGQGLFFITLAVTLPIYAVFSMLGALLGLAIFRKKTPPQAPVVEG